jgi:hypothetical protein
METWHVTLKPIPFDIKALIKDVARSHIKQAKEAKVLLLLAVDPIIPELVMGDMVRSRFIPVRCSVLLICVVILLLIFFVL